MTSKSPDIAVSEWEALMAYVVEQALAAERPWSGQITFENQLTGDNRLFKLGAVNWDESVFPLPFRWVRSDSGGHMNAVLIGRVDRVFRAPDAPGVIFAGGVIFSGEDAPPEANEYLNLLESGAAGGVSIDADSPIYEIVPTGLPAPTNQRTETTDPSQDQMQVFSSIRIRGLTAVDIPAFISAKIHLDDAEASAS